MVPPGACATGQGPPITLVGAQWWSGFGQSAVPGPSDVYIRSVKTENGSIATLNTGIKAGNLLIAILTSTFGSMSADPAWTLLASGGDPFTDSLGMWWKRADVGDPGKQWGFGSTGVHPSITIVELASLTGATVSIDASTGISVAGPAPTFVQPAIGAVSANSLVLNFVLAANGGIVPPVGGFIYATPNVSVAQGQMYTVPQAGPTPPSVWTGNNGAWVGMQVAIKSNATLLPLQVGDLLIGIDLTSPGLSTPAGWNFLGQYGNLQRGNGAPYGQLFWKLATFADVIAAKFSLSGLGSYSFNAILAWRNVFQAGPIEAFIANKGTGTDVVAKGMSGLPPGCVALYIGNQDDVFAGGFPIVPITLPLPQIEIFRDYWSAESPTIGANSGSASAGIAYQNLGNATSIADQHFTLGSSYLWGAAMIIICPAFLPAPPPLVCNIPGNVPAFSDGSCPLGFVADPNDPGCCKPFVPTPKPPVGDLVGLTFNEEQGVVAWHRHPMIGAVEAIACIPNPNQSQDDLWMIVNRTINGVTKRYIEYMAPHFVTGDSLVSNALYSDSGSTYSGPPTKIITGLGRLEGRTVKVLTDGSLHPDVVVTGGQIALLWAASVVQIGLPQTAKLTTMPIEAGAQTGTAQGKTKRITDVNLRFNNTLGGKVGREDPDAELQEPPVSVFDDLEFRSPVDPMNTPVPVYNGIFPRDTYDFPFPGGYEVEGRITYINDTPYPATLASVYPVLDVED